MADLILLVGNPNAGKSTLFNRLTRGHARVGNWHGVTVDALEGKMDAGGREATLVDLPGVYGAEGRSMEEKFACRYIAERKQAALVFVSECAGLKRAIPLMHAFTAGKRRCALVLTKRKRFERDGGAVDAAALENLLGIPVVYAEGDVAAALAHMLVRPPCEVPIADMGASFTPAREGLSRFDRLLLNPFFGLPLFVALLLFAFFFTFRSGMPGDLAKRGVEWIFSDFLGGYAAGIPSPVVRSLVQDGILASLGSVLSILPQIALLHLFLILLEESGLMSRLAILTDGVLGKLGLSGRTVFPLLMGFGCTAAAVTTTRGLEEKRLQRRVIACLPYISCSAKLPVYLVLASSFFSDPFPAVLLLYAMGVGIALIVALFLREKSAPLVMELAPLQVPQPRFVVKSLLFQIKQFIIKVATVVLAFFIASWLLSSFDFTLHLSSVEGSMLATLCGWLSFLFAPAGMHDWRITYAAISGLIAKENVAGAIAMFYGSFPYGPESAFAFAVFMLACSPCVSAIAATARELGVPRALLYAAAQTVSALLLCYAVYFCLTGGVLYLIFAAVLLAAVFLLGYESVHRKRKHHLKGLHRRRLSAGVDVAPHPSQTARSARKRRKGLFRRPVEGG